MQDSSNKNFPLLYDSSTFCSNFAMPIEKPLLVKLVHWLSEIELFDTSSSSIFIFKSYKISFNESWFGPCSWGWRVGWSM